MKAPAMTQCERGSIMVEAAVIVPLLALILIGIIDLGRVFYLSTAVTGAAAAGAQYGASSTARNADFAGMLQAVLNDAGNVSGVTATASAYCECVDGSATSCSSSCGSATAPKFIKVTVGVTFAALFPIPSIPSSFPVSATAVKRIR